MGGFELLLLAIPVIFVLALLFAILLWCRGWRREEGQEMDRRLKLLTEQVTRLAEAVAQLQKTQAAARTAEGRLSEQMTALFANVSRFLSAPPSSASHPGDKSPGYISPTSSTSHPGDKSPGHDSPPPDRYDRAREMLASGADPVEVARALDISLGDVHVLQRLLNLKPKG
ncbi:MAG: hypothetical protein A3F84_01735 [Candidatus Handelsmanbacteria bacterium RIFCSPLOWO2_12_FULL_64_10]|uniref:DUF2802 domain-containing protein n=1 Tax=Handelsmanbacteria sp. (strain RIFCSPLOWO2_12_FULL_64_10) TaxID=1817868 RepID=A0A1F6D3M6_HANXR|nr:MAG: hypothetical protein A3F84_01735 [Candidatus Handelsmanbacteria bacterium RIFCSPLOWO2_12_FULL_64_10]